jgi:uncharacterized RDD family membrane protein YckC
MTVENEAPGLARRLAAFCYEGVLLFAVVFIADYLFSALTQQRNAMQGRAAGQAFLFVVLGIYFGWFWSHGGQTVAMKAWHLRVVDSLGRPLTQGRALARYVLSWLWFLPALASAYLAGLKTTGGIFGCMIAGVIAYVLIARLHPSRQFLHDLLCGTRLVTQLPNKNKP